MLVREFWKIPFLRLLLPFIAGIVLAGNVHIFSHLWLGLILFAFALTLVYRPFFDHNLSYHNRWIFGLIINAGLICIGAYLGVKSLEYDKNLGKSEILICLVNEPVKEGANSFKTELKVKSYLSDKIWHQSNQKILAYLEKDSLVKNLNYGDLIVIKAKLDEISNARNPGEFDYKKFLNRKQIHFRTYLNSENWQFIGANEGNPLFRFAYQVKQKTLDIYSRSGISGDEFGLLAALTLGTKDYLSEDIIEAYSSTGAMHILAVSGLHVGIIFFVLNYVFYFFRRDPLLRIVQAIALILAIWCFALITGLSPSVNRAATMITFVILGRLSRVKPSTYNSVAASAFILLFINPQSLYHVGFQLSYLAVLGILFFQPKLDKLYQPRNRIIRYMWGLTTVSMAAQIGTTAVSIYYFHQFPVYAFLANLIVIPGAFIIMVLAILLLVVSGIFPVAKIVAWVLSHFIYAMNRSTVMIESLPASSIYPISLNQAEVMLFYLAIVCIMVYLVTKNLKMPVIAIGCLILAFVSRNYRYIENLGTKTFTVYNVARKSAFSVIKDGNFVLYADTAMINQKKSIHYLTSTIRAKDFIKTFHLQKLAFHKRDTAYRLNLKKHIFEVDTIRFAYLPGDYSRFISNEKLKVHFLILSKNAPMDVVNIRKIVDFDLLIVDSSVSKWKQEILKRDCQQMAIPLYNVSESGAFVHRIR
jgi:competence protein ComEC